MKISDLKKSIREMIVAELSETTIDVPNPNTLTPSQKDTFIKQTRATQKNPTIGTPKDPVDFVEEAPNPLSKRLTDLEKEESSLMSKLNKISQLKKEVESSLGINKVDESQVNEMAKIAGDLASAIKSVVDSNSDLEGLALKKAIKADAAVKAALAGDELYDNQLNKYILLLKGERELGQRGRKADPEIAAKRSEEEKAKEEKRAEKEAKRAEKERAKAPAQKPASPEYKKTTTMVDMSGEPSDKDITKAEKELGIDIPKVKKPSKLSAEDQAKFDVALKGITAKVNRIKDKKAKPDDLTLLKKVYNDEGIKKLFRKAGKNLDDLVAGVIGGKDKGEDIESDEL